MNIRRIDTINLGNGFTAIAVSKLPVPALWKQHFIDEETWLDFDIWEGIDGELYALDTCKLPTDIFVAEEDEDAWIEARKAVDDYYHGLQVSILGSVTGEWESY